MARTSSLLSLVSVLIATAQAQEAAAPATQEAEKTALQEAASPAPPPLSPCQECCSPGGDVSAFLIFFRKLERCRPSACLPLAGGPSPCAGPSLRVRRRPVRSASPARSLCPQCSRASHGSPGICCGRVNGAGPGYCCAFDAKCTRCATSYRCYKGARPPSSVCAFDGGSVTDRRDPSSMRGAGLNEPEEVVSSLLGFICMVFLFVAILNCLRRRRPPLAAQQEIAMVPVGGPMCGMPMAVGGHPVAVAVGQPGATSANIPTGRPLPAGASASQIPIATAHPVGQPVVGTAGGCYPAAGAAYPAGGYPVHQQPGYGGGYGGGSVAMGAGMGFLGGMMVGDMMSSHHHGGGYGGDYGGGDYGGGGDFGGGDFAADM